MSINCIIDFLVKRTSAIFSIILSFILAWAFVKLLIICGPPTLATPEMITPLNIAPLTTRFGPVIIKTTGPNYFRSVGRVYACIWSTYAQYFGNFTIEMSVDDHFWKEVPIHHSKPDILDLENYVELGLVELNTVTIPIFSRSNVPPQTIVAPANVTKLQISQSFSGHIKVISESSPRDTIIQMLITFTLWSILIRVIDLLFLRNYS